MNLVELGARSMDLVDLEFLELGCLAEKKWSEAIFVDLELRGALPNTPTLPYPWTLLWWTWLHVVSQQRYIADVKKFE
jgi:hypothetical protein